TVARTTAITTTETMAFRLTLEFLSYSRFQLKNGARYSTEVVRLEVHGSVFRLVSTDGHRLSLVEGAAKSHEEATHSVLVLRSTASILSRLGLAEEPRWVQFSTCGPEQEFLLFVLPDGAGIIARRGQGQFPNYENVLPKTPLEARVVFHREELLDGLT